MHLVETHHDLGGRPLERVRGRTATGWDAAVDDRLEDARTGEVVTADRHDVLVTVRTTR